MSADAVDDDETGGRRPRPSGPASPLENDDIVAEFLLRLPPAPSSLPRASFVCKRWHGIVSDPGFLSRFRARHRCNPPLLGFLGADSGEISFTPILDPPDRIPSGRFSLDPGDKCRIVGCRHGLALIHNLTRLQLLVWDPVTGDQHYVAYAHEFYDNISRINGSVLRAAGDVCGGDSSHFQVVLVSTDKGGTQAIASVYSSETGEWGDLISTACMSMLPIPWSGILVGGSLFWLLEGIRDSSHGLLEFDLDRQCLAVTKMPQEMSAFAADPFSRIMRAEGGGLGLLVLSYFTIQLWKRMTDGDAGWVQLRSIDLEMLSLDLRRGYALSLHGYVEENNALIVTTRAKCFVIYLDSTQLKESFETSDDSWGLPFSCVYTPGMHIGRRQDGAELSQNA